MQVDVSYVLEAYKEEMGKMHQEIILLKATIEQLKHDLEQAKKVSEE